jgi:spoIIIJ-associated protein
MEWVETTGRSVDEAKEAALDELGVDESDAEFEVLEEAKSGLFGRLRSEARVRARVRPTTPRAKEERRDRRRRRGSESNTSERARGNGGSGGSGDGTATGDDAAASDAGADQDSDGGRDPAESAVSSGPGESPGSRRQDRRPSGRRPGGGGGNRGGGGRGGGSGSNGGAERRERQGRNQRTNEEEASDVEVALEEQGRVAKEFLTELIAEFGLEATIAIEQPDEDTIDLQLEGSDLGLLIGQKGATLLAIQDLTRTAVHHQTKAGNGRIHVDVGGYRQKRSEALARFARQVASTVQQSGERTVLEPMNAADRKVVHDALTDVEGVSTISEGEDPGRRVVVIPTEQS